MACLRYRQNHRTLRVNQIHPPLRRGRRARGCRRVRLWGNSCAFSGVRPRALARLQSRDGPNGPASFPEPVVSLSPQWAGLRPEPAGGDPSVCFTGEAHPGGQPDLGRERRDRRLGRHEGPGHLGAAGGQAADLQNGGGGEGASEPCEVSGQGEHRGFAPGCLGGRRQRPTVPAPSSSLLWEG